MRIFRKNNRFLFTFSIVLPILSSVRNNTNLGSKDSLTELRYIL